jgi:hypothetical protein
MAVKLAGQVLLTKMLLMHNILPAQAPAVCTANMPVTDIPRRSAAACSTPQAAQTSSLSSTRQHEAPLSTALVTHVLQHSHHLHFESAFFVIGP